MADVTINQLTQGVPNKNSAVIPYSDGTTTLKTSPSGIVAASPGSTLKVVQSYMTEYQDILNLVSWTDIISPVNNVGLICSITPESAFNKVYVQVCINWDGYTMCPLFRLVRNGTAVGASTAGNTLNGVAGGYGFGSVYAPNSSVFNFLDTPNSTSLQTYKVQVSTVYNNGTLKINRSADNKYGMASSITLTEIAG